MAENPRITAPESVRIKAGEFAVNHCGSLWISVDPADPADPVDCNCFNQRQSVG
ncbi:hypothetical protein [Paenibacillus odorifer]|uniref:hypothetical protein n=1 Tax=Paenibacillus odorifer TaxID=189426 RepID=UPI0015C365AA|nr:hypothetical protein [Paenibacillus odorifer]